MDPSKISIKNVSFSYEENHNVINDISMDINDKECVSIVGVSGAGKSTLLRLISGLENSSSNLQGHIIINGIENKKYLESNRGKLSYMFQTPTLIPSMSVKDNILLPLKILKKEKSHKSFFEKLVSQVGLKNTLKMYPSKLSGGMKSRLSLVRNYITSPEILLMDEPFTALDVAWKYELYKMFFVLKNIYLTTILVVTHDIQEAIILSDKVMVLNSNGTLGKTYQITRVPNIESLSNYKELLKLNSDNYINIHNDILNNLGKMDIE